MQFDLAEELYQHEWFLKKVREDKRYAQNLYSAFCNMRWQKLELLPILKDNYWSCSWRSAGGIVAEIRGGNEDYMDYYCSGMGGFTAFADEDPEDTERAFRQKGYVPEGHVTEEVMHDLNKMGWLAVPWPKDD